jgi:hypothetical protein
MKSGRPPGWALDPASLSSVVVEVRELDQKRGRLTLSPRCLAALTWVPATGKLLCLLVMEEPGRVRVLPWEPHGLKVVERRRAAAESEEYETILRLDDHYLRSTIVAGRLVLPELAVTHLQPRRTRSATFYVIAVADGLEIWSVAYRNGRRQTWPDDFEDLP